MTDPARASFLESDATPEELVAELAATLGADLNTEGQACIARELRDGDDLNSRPVIQFAVNRALFDRFFNSRIGYRAHFRTHYKCGLRYNNAIIAAVCRVADKELPAQFEGRLIRSGGVDLGPKVIRKDWLLRWLEPYVSKIWYCELRVGEPIDRRTIFIDRQGASIGVEGADDWSALDSEPEAWLEIKGRFDGSPRYDQGKKLIQCRARGLRDRGTA